jgi:thiol-disulfide isomerase/thioredoxin
LSKPSPTRRPARPATPTTRKPAPAAAAKASSKRLPVALIAGAALAVGLIAVIVVTMGSGGDAPVELGTPAITGDSLPEFSTIENDTAVGMTIPEVIGADFAGTPVSITRDGRAKVIMFFAHWCGVCQQEVPLITGWLPGAALPEGVDLISVSTGVNPNQANYPPSAWLEREGWPVPVIFDDAGYGVADAFGLSAYPYFVFVDPEGKVFVRLTGGLSTATIESIINELAGA